MITRQIESLPSFGSSHGIYILCAQPADKPGIVKASILVNISHTDLLVYSGVFVQKTLIHGRQF